VTGGILFGLCSDPTGGQTPTPPPRDAVQEVQQPRPVPETRPEQRKTEHDRSSVFDRATPAPSSPALSSQPDGGRMQGFDFARDPLGAKKPMQSFEETMREDVAAKPGVMATQRRVSRGEVVSFNNFHRLFKDLITPVQLDGLRMLLTPFPQEEFNATDDRKSASPSLGVACLDCHVNGHTTGQFHLNPDDRPQERRFRLDTTSLRGVANQQLHGSKRSLRSVEDFTEFEQRTAYFNGDPIRADSAAWPRDRPAP